MYIFLDSVMDITGLEIELTKRFIDLTTDQNNADIIVKIRDILDAREIQKQNSGKRTFWIFVGTENLDSINFLKKISGPNSFKGLGRPSDFIKNNGNNFICIEKFNIEEIASGIDKELSRSFLNMSDTDISIPSDIFADMQKRLVEYIHQNGCYPDVVKIGSSGISDETWNRLNKRNRINWKKDDGKFLSISKFTEMDIKGRDFFAKHCRDFDCMRTRG